MAHRDHDPAQEPAEPDRASDLADRDQLERGLRRLNEAQRTILVLHFYLDLSLAGAAEAMGIPVGTAKSRLHYAIEALRAALAADARTVGRLAGKAARHDLVPDLGRRLADHSAVEAPTRAPDWVLGSALAKIETTTQRRALLRSPWRFLFVGIDAKLAVAAFAVIAVGGLLWLGGTSGPLRRRADAVRGTESDDRPGQRTQTRPGTGCHPRTLGGGASTRWLAQRSLRAHPRAQDGQRPTVGRRAVTADAWQRRRLLRGDIHFGPTSACAESGSYRWALGKGGSSFGTLVLEAISDSCTARRSLIEGWWDRMTSTGTPDPVGVAEEWLEGGRHSLTVDGLPLSFSVPTLSPDRGWARYRSLYISKDISASQSAEAVVYWTAFPDGDQADPCGVLSLPIGPSIADLANAVATAPYTKVVEGPSDATVGGRPAKHVVLSVLEDLGCDPGFFYTWLYQPGGRDGGRRTWATRLMSGSSMWTGRASSSPARPPRAPALSSSRRSSRSSTRSSSSSAIAQSGKASGPRSASCWASPGASSAGSHVYG